MPSKSRFLGLDFLTSPVLHFLFLNFIFVQIKSLRLIRIKETTDPKVYFTNQDKQNLKRVKHSTPFKGGC